MKRLYPLISAILLSIGLISPLKGLASAKRPVSKNEFNDIVDQGVPANALNMALKGYEEAMQAGKVKNKRYLTVVDFSKPSTEKRLYVIDLVKNKVIYNEYVAHGQGSGSNKPNNFSNKQGSHASELGTIVTDNVYYGKHGESLRLNGVDPANANIRSRAIVVHAAYYATEDFIDAHNRLGRSWGCFAIDPAIAPAIIDTIKGGSVIYAYSDLDMKTV